MKTKFTSFKELGEFYRSNVGLAQSVEYKNNVETTVEMLIDLSECSWVDRIQARIKYP